MKYVYHKQQRAFTVIELILVIAIVSILVTIGSAGWREFYAKSGTDASGREVLAVLEKAHARTLSADGGTEYGVHFTAGTVTLFEGDTYNAMDASNEVLTLSRSAITDISLTGGTSDIVFSRLRGTASATGTVTVTQNADASEFRIITISEAGLSEISL